MIEPQLTVEEFITDYMHLLDPQDGAPDRTELVAIEAWWIQQGDYAETSLAALFKLTGNRWAALTSWCDTTGYDCQYGTDWVITPTREAAISQGLDQESRRLLGLTLSNDCDYKTPSTDADGKCRCLICGRCGHHTGNTHQGHYWSFCKVTRTDRDFHFCCPGDCEIESSLREGDGDND